MKYIHQASEEDLGIYSFQGMNKEKIDCLLHLLQDNENILFRSKGKIPVFEGIMRDFFPGLPLEERSTHEGIGYNSFDRGDHAFVSAYSRLNREDPTQLELRLYPYIRSPEETQVKIGLFPINYNCNPVDDIVLNLTHHYAVREIQLGYTSCDKVIQAVDSIPQVLQSYAQARDLFVRAPKILAEEDLRGEDLNRLYFDKDHSNRVIRKQSKIEYDRLLQLLVCEGKSS